MDTATRNPMDVPFASTSFWNIGIGSNAQWSLGTDVDARQLHGLRGVVTTSEWGQPIYFGTASDPLVTVTNSDTLYPVAPQHIHIPIGALPAAGSGGYTDAHMTFYDATQPGKMWSYWGASLNNGYDVTGGISAGLGGVYDTTGDGVDNRYNFAAGTITDYDVSQGAINHMVRLALSPEATKSPGGTELLPNGMAPWDIDVPWPTSHTDWFGYQNYTGNIVAGSTFGIPMSVNLNSLGLSQGGMMLAKALQNYGGIWRDQGGTNQITFYSTPENQNNPLIQQMQADLAKIVPTIEVLRNQAPNSVNGGGTSVVPLLPPVSLDGGTTTPPPVVLPITYGTGPDSLVLQISEDAYSNGDATSNARGDATFTVSIDGKQIGGTFTNTASHAAGQDQDVTLNGYFGPGTHSVSVNFLNDAYSGTPSTDRNLYVESVTYNGLNTNQSVFLARQGAGVFTIRGGTSVPPPTPSPAAPQTPTPITFGSGPDSLVLQVSDDAYANGDGTSNAKGDAMFTVSIDGKQIGGTFTTTASHAAGQEQAVTLNGDFGPGTHNVSVKFLNDAWGRESIQMPTGTPRTQLLAYLQSLTGNHALIGQTSYPGNASFNADTQAFGFSPAIMFSDPWIQQWAGNFLYDDSFMPAALAHAKAGGIVGMSLQLPNPAVVGGGPTQEGPAPDPVKLLTPGTALNTQLNHELDQAAGLLQQFKDAGVAVLTRYMFELDGGWFWWGSTSAGGNFTPAQQTQLFQYITNYLRVTKGLDNLLTTFAINGGPGTYQYPGDNYVDVVGIDCYNNNLASTYKGVYDTLISQAPTKLFALTEDGSGNSSSPDPNYDLTRLKADIQSALPRTVFANFWSGWEPSLGTNAKAAMSDPFWVNKSQVSLGGGPTTSPPVDPTPITFGTPSTDRNLYVDSITYNGLNNNRSAFFAGSGAQGFTINDGTSVPPPTPSPTAPQPPTPITFGSGPDSLVLQVSEDAYANGDGTSNARGDAVFTVSIDGKQIGGTFAAAASHAAGQEQSVTLNGDFGAGIHHVLVNFPNDAWGASPSADRNLYVDSVTYNGLNTNQAGSLAGEGTQGFTVSGSITGPDIASQTPGKPIGAGDTTPANSVTNDGSMVDLAAPGVSSAVLGSAADRMEFIGLSGVAPTAGSVQSTAVNEVRANTIAGGKDPFGVTGESGIALHHLFLAMGNNLAIDQSPHNSSQGLSDEHGATGLSTGVNADEFDLTALRAYWMYDAGFL